MLLVLWRTQAGGIRKLEVLFATLRCLSLNRFASFCPFPLLNDCDQPTLIILTGYLQFDEYVDGSSVLRGESDFKIGPL